jgi:CRISPR-associated protein Cst2
LIELDRVGCGEGFENELSSIEKAKRVKAFLLALKNLWSSGRQTRFLTDISPKFVAAAILKVKNPVFLESVAPLNGGINVELLQETLDDFKEEIIEHVFGARKSLFDGLPDKTLYLKDAFASMGEWVDRHYL